MWIHELLHLFNWDQLCAKRKIHNSLEMKSMIMSDDLQPVQFESVVEAFSCYLHCYVMGGPKHWKKLLVEHQKKQLKTAAVIHQHFKSIQTNTNVWCYYYLKTALILNEKSTHRFLSWLENPSVERCQQTWNELRTQSLQDLNTLLQSKPKPTLKPKSNTKKTKDSGSCISFKKSNHQLSLAPSLLKS